MFQDQVLPKIIERCQKALEQSWGVGHTYEVKQSLEFWQEVLRGRREKPYDPEAPRAAGKYVVIRASAHITTDEWTNVGLMVFDWSDNQIFAKVGPFDRAIARRDLGAADHWKEYLHLYPKNYPTLEQVRRSLQATGHFMSHVQMTEPRSLLLDDENIRHLYDSMVLGLPYE